MGVEDSLRHGVTNYFDAYTHFTQQSRRKAQITTALGSLNIPVGDSTQRAGDGRWRLEVLAMQPKSGNPCESSNSSSEGS